MFLSTEKYRLELHWKKVDYNKAGMCLLKDAYFSGPVLSIAERINSNDHIKLDFCMQYAVIVKGVYIAKLSWGEVVYNKNGTVFLKNCIIEEDSLNTVPKLDQRDYIVIDTRDHERAVHAFNMLYPAQVVNENDELYNFRS